jgi:hypothetical protein
MYQHLMTVAALTISASGFVAQTQDSCRAAQELDPRPTDAALFRFNGTMTDGPDGLRLRGDVVVLFRANILCANEVLVQTSLEKVTASGSVILVDANKNVTRAEKIRLDQVPARELI